MNKKETSAGKYLLIIVILMVTILMLSIKYIDLNSKGGISLAILWFCYILASFFIGNLVTEKTNPFFKTLIFILIAPAIVIHLILGLIHPLMAVSINLVIYMVICFLPALVFSLINDLGIISLAYEEQMFFTLTIATIGSILFNKIILKFIFKYSPIFRNINDKTEPIRSRKESIKLRRLIEYLFVPNNIRFMIYLSYFIFLLYFSDAYITNDIVTKNRLLDNAILQAFLVFLAYDSIRINSKDLKLVPTIILKKYLDIIKSNDIEDKKEN